MLGLATGLRQQFGFLAESTLILLLRRLCFLDLGLVVAPVFFFVLESAIDRSIPTYHVELKRKNNTFAQYTNKV